MSRVPLRQYPACGRDWGHNIDRQVGVLPRGDPSRRARMKGRGGLVLATVTLGAAALGSTAGAGSSTVARTQWIKCSSTMKPAVRTPYTGPAAFLGQDQGSWANLAVKNIGAKLGLKFKIVAADSTLDPAVAATAAQK